ncbi:DUF2674 domain-containing protein [Rickettsia endosymbiont of Cardiosporidium cionae]|uniref:DUF2674 domain-containing protein n=1 Tax=Rickettsia endosymbiont of Cardiosporidium cionae TaxID=2777155 RepID=UPI001894EED8|nr:DUF2674 domain-containing protein [Rickettsia endosymbiont of Cardiosporidium cionae]
MIYKKPSQKLVLFTESDTDLVKISKDIENGWSIVNLVKNENHYVGIMEQITKEYNENGEEIVFIPPRKKLKIST